MDDEQIKKAVLAVIERSVPARELAAAFGGPRSTPAAEASAGATRLLTRIVLGDILDDAILVARPSDRTFPLRLFFGELGRFLASEDESTATESAFTLASGLNFYFRATMESDAKMWVGLEVSRQLYAFAAAAKLEADVLARSAPLLAALMNNELERLKLESVDHVKVFDSQLHERAAGSDQSSFNIVRPTSFLCRVATNNAVKAKAGVLT